MTVVTIHKAKTTLSQLIKRVEAGEVIEIARRDHIVAQLTAVGGEGLSGGAHSAKALRAPGGLEHLKGRIPDSAFFDDLPDDELKMWESGD